MWLRGTFATGGSFYDLALLYVLGLPLGPALEEQALRAVLLEGGSVSGLFATPLSIVLWLVVAAALVTPVVLALRRRALPA